MHINFHFLWLLAFFASLVLSGCQGFPPVTTTAPTSANKTVTVRIVGEVTSPKELSLSPARANLRMAIQTAGGPSDFEDSFKNPVLLFAKLTRGNVDFFISTDMIEDSELGDIPLRNAEVISVVPWLETDLARGVIAAGSISKSRAYSFNQKVMSDAYAVTPQNAEGKIVDYQFFSSVAKGSPPSLVKVLSKSPDGGIMPLVMSQLKDVTNLGLNEVFLVNRKVDDRETNFIFSRGTLENGDRVITTTTMLRYSPVFPGDMISIVEPKDVPIVQSYSDRNSVDITPQKPPRFQDQFKHK